MTLHTDDAFVFFAHMPLEQCLARLKTASETSPYAVELLYLNADNYEFRIYHKGMEPPAGRMGALSRWTSHTSGPMTRVTLFDSESRVRLMAGGAAVWLLMGVCALSTPALRTTAMLVSPLWVLAAGIAMRRWSGSNSQRQNMVNLVKDTLRYADVQSVPVVKQLLN